MGWSGTDGSHGAPPRDMRDGAGDNCVIILPGNRAQERERLPCFGLVDDPYREPGIDQDVVT